MFIGKNFILFTGIAAGLDGYSVVYTALGMLVISFVLMNIGQFLGRVFGVSSHMNLLFEIISNGFLIQELVPEKYLSLISGLALVTIGVFDLPFTPDMQ